MFGGKQKCQFCGNKTSKKYNFCPYCGKSLKETNEFFQPTFKLGFPFDQLVRQMEKQIEKQFKELDTDLGEFKMKEYQPKKPMQSFSISISTGNGKPVIKMGPSAVPMRVEKREEEKAERAPEKELSGEEIEKLEKLSKLPKEEPKTSVRRLTDKIIYEITLPGVKKEDIIINKMHNSLEIKAFTKDKAFFKLIPIALPIIKSHLKEGKLILEFNP